MVVHANGSSNYYTLHGSGPFFDEAGYVNYT